MNLRKKMKKNRHYRLYFQNKIWGLWGGRKSIKVVSGRVILLAIIALAIVFIFKGLIALTNFLRLHSVKIIFLSFALWVVLDAGQQDKTQAKINSVRKKEKDIIHNDQWKVIFSRVRKFSVLRSRGSTRKQARTAHSPRGRRDITGRPRRSRKL